MAEQIVIDIALKSQLAGANAAKASLDNVGKSADKATGAAKQFDSQLNKTNATAKKTNETVALLKQSMATLGIAFSIKAVTTFTDNVTRLETQLKNVSSGSADVARNFNSLYSIARRTGDSFTGIVDTFTRLNTALPDAVRNTTDLTKVTELLSRGLAASGTNAQAASAVMIQLTQGLSGNFANAAQEISSLIEGAPLLARTIAEQLGGKAATDLKKFAEAGELTTDSFLKALLASEKTINSYQLPPTIGRAIENVRTEFTRLASESPAFAAAAGAIAAAITGIANNLDAITTAAVLAAGAMATLFAVSKIGVITSFAAAVIGNVGAFIELAKTVKTAAQAMALFNAATMVNPITLMVGAIGAAATAMFVFRKEIAEVLGITATLGDVWNAVWTDTIMNSINRAIDRMQKFIIIAKDAFSFGEMDIADKANLDAINARIDAANSKSDKGLGTLISDRTDARMGEQVKADYAAASAEMKKAIEANKANAKVVKVSGDVSKEALKAQKAGYSDLISAIDGAKTEQERLTDSIAEMEALRGFAKSEKEAKGLETAISRARQELADLATEAELNGPTARAFQSLASEIDDGFKDAFKSAFEEGGGGFKGMLDGWKSTLKNFLAEMAYQAFARPLIVPIVGAVGSAMGLSGSAVNQSVLGSTGGQGSVGMLGGGTGNILSLGSSLLNGGLYSQTLGGIGTGVGNLLAGNGFNFIGPTQAGAIGAGAFGNMGYGAIGSLGANLLGLGGGIGGTIGGIGGSLAGGAIGTSIGSILGMAGGPVGAVIGSFLGTALGGLFGGGKPSDMVQGGKIDLATLAEPEKWGMTGKKFSQSNADFRDAVLQEVSNLTGLFKSVGGTTSGKLKIDIGSRDGLRLNDKNYGLNQTNFLEAVFKQVADSTTGLSDTFQKILNTVGYKDTQKLAEGFEFGKMFDAVVNPVDNVAEAIKAVNTQFDDLIKKSTDLGLTSSVFTQKVEEQRKAQLDLIKAQQAGFASLEAMKEGFDKWLYDQSLGSTSSLSPTQKLLAAQGNFGGLLGAVQGGDKTKTQELLSAGQQLLQIGQSMYASSVDFAMLERFVRDSIGSVARELGVPGYASGTRSAASGMRWVGENGPELVRFGGGERVYNAEESKMMARGQAQNDQRFNEMNSNIADMRDDISRMTRQLGRVANNIVAQKVVASV